MYLSSQNKNVSCLSTYRLTTVMTHKRDVITSITGSLKGLTVILGMFVKTIKTDVIVFIGNVKM